MDPYNAPVGWFDVEVSPDHPRRAQRQQAASLFPQALSPPSRPPVMNMAAVFHQQELEQRLQQQQQSLIQEQKPQRRIVDVEVVEEPQQRITDKVIEDASLTQLQDYLENLISRVEKRGSSRRGGPLHSQELTELTLQASRDDSVFVKVDADTMTTITQWLYEQVLYATSLSILKEAGRVLTEDTAPSQAMAALQMVRRNERNNLGRVIP